MKTIQLLCLLCCSSLAFATSGDSTLSQIYQEVGKGNSASFYCDCVFDLQKMQLKDKNCGQKIGQSAVFFPAVTWERVVSKSEFTDDLQCWHEPQSLQGCRNENKVLSSQQCCEEVSEEYRARAANIHNQIPVIQNIAEKLQGLGFGQVYREPIEFGACQLKIDSQLVRKEPPDQIKGDIARIYFYFESLGYVRLSRRSRPLMEIWDMKDPVSNFECALHSKKAAISGLKNPYVANRCP